MAEPSPAGLAWYVGRLGRMSPGEVAWRVREQALRRAWARRQVRPGQVASLPPPLVAAERRFTSVLPAGAAAAVPEAARAALLSAADRLMAGEWEAFGVVRGDMKAPDWFHDPVTGRRSDQEAYAFGIKHRDERAVGNIKQVWEVNRLQHLTLLAAAWYLTRDDAYAERVDAQLRSWWAANPFLSGVNWTSGIELGVRLINFAWIRRLLNEWPGVADLFDRNDLALHQVRWHQQYLGTFESRGSSANNHLIAEAAGQLAASCAFPWFAESARWRRQSAALLEKSLRDNTFPSGINRELASDYHGFVFELGAFAAVEAAVAGFPVSDDCWRLLAAMADGMAALVDARLRPPRQGDSDEGRVVLLDAPEHNRWPALLSLAAGLFGPLAWWPPVAPDAGRVLAAAVTGAPRTVAGRPDTRPSRFADAGITILRTDPASGPEIWCRCDGGPHGFLSIAAHAHADALSVEVRHDGADILADPGTYCYHGEPEWRTYFRSTIGHNTVQIGGRDQSQQSGPFMWAGQARTRQIESSQPQTVWTAEHDGYRAVLRPPASHRRTVSLDQAGLGIEIADVIDGAGHEVRLAFHLGPDVTAELAGDRVALSWPARSGTASARLDLPRELSWSLHRGETGPILGWYSLGLGQRTPAVTLLGSGQCTRDSPLMTRLQFAEAGQPVGLNADRAAESRKSSTSPVGVIEIQAETR
jgi:Heparinase II/III-like protein/Heparinase II/III N-terminus